MGYEVHVAANFIHFGTISSQSNQDFIKWLKKKQVIIHNIPIRRKLGNFNENIKVVLFLNRIMRENNFRFVHIHTPIASILGRIVACKNNVPVIYTAHGFHFSKNTSFLNWFVFPLEWIFSFKTEQLLLINEEDFRLAKKTMLAKKILYVPGVGINFNILGKPTVKEHDKLKNELLLKYSLPKESKVLISVGELSIRKNHSVVIKAIAMLRDENVHYFIAGRGNERENLGNLAFKLGITSQIHFLDYTKNIRELNLAADLAILPSLREGLSRAGLESISDGTYLLGANIRGVKDYIFNEEIGGLFDPHNENALARLIKQNINHSRTNLSWQTVSKLMVFDRGMVDHQMRDIYRGMGEGYAN